MGRVRRGGEHLRSTHIRAAEHADLAIRAGQARGPFNRVVAVGRFIPEWVKLAFGIKAPPRVLHDHDVTMGGEKDPGRRVLTIVRRACQQHRKRAVGLRTVDVGDE